MITNENLESFAACAQGELQGVAFAGVQVLREKRLISLHDKSDRRTIKYEVKLHPPLCCPLRHFMMRSCRSSSVNFCVFFAGKFCGKFGRNFADFFGPTNKGFNIS